MPVAIAKQHHRGSPDCGDQGGYWENETNTTLCLADGLGHGKEAQTAAQAAIDYVGQHLDEPLTALFAGCNRALWKTRGVAMGVAVIDEQAGTLTYAGIGNTRVRIIGENSRGLTSDYGIVGGGYRKLVPETVPLAPGDLVVMVTDGIKERFDVVQYVQATRSDLGELAQKILEDGVRETDDAAVLVFKRTVK